MFLKARQYKDYPVTAIQEKLDGHRAMIDKRWNEPVIHTRVEGVDLWPIVKEVPHLRDIVLRVPTGMLLDVEIHKPGEYATSVKTFLKEGHEDLIMTGLGIVGKDMSVLDSIIEMRKIIGLHLPDTRYLGQAQALTEDRVDELKQEALEKKLEGWILKRRNYEGWYKVKPVHQIEAVVMGSTVSESATYFGQIRGLILGLYKDGELVEIARTGNGLKASFKEDYEHRRDELVGRVVDVQFDEVAAKGRLKFPRIVSLHLGEPRWREDKRPEECTFDQLPERRQEWRLR